MTLSVTFRRGEHGDELVIQKTKSRVVAQQFRSFIEAEAAVEGRSFEEQVAEFYSDAQSCEDPDMALGHTELFEKGSKYLLASWLLQHAFQRVDLINFFDGPHNAGCEMEEELEAELVELRSRLTPEEVQHLDAAIVAALSLDGAAVREHVQGLREVAARWKAEEGE